MSLGLIAFLVGSAFTGWAFWIKGVPGQPIETPMLEWAWEFCTPNVLLATFGIFLMFSTIERQDVPKPIAGLSKLSFGMYLMHLFYLAPIARLVIGGDVANSVIPVWAAIPVIAIATFICCAITSKLISLLPGSKWIIGA